MMPKMLLLLLAFLMLAVLPLGASASAIDDARNGLKSVAAKIGFDTNAEGGGSIAVVVGRVIKVALGLVGIIFLVLTLYGGWLYMTAAGSQERVEKARNLLRDSIIGLIIVITAYAITTFVVAAIVGVTE
jgi:hypothetical protein